MRAQPFLTGCGYNPLNRTRSCPSALIFALHTPVLTDPFISQFSREGFCTQSEYLSTTCKRKIFNRDLSARPLLFITMLLRFLSFVYMNGTSGKRNNPGNGVTFFELPPGREVSRHTKTPAPKRGGSIQKTKALQFNDQHVGPNQKQQVNQRARA